MLTISNGTHRTAAAKRTTSTSSPGTDTSGRSSNSSPPAARVPATAAATSSPPVATMATGLIIELPARSLPVGRVTNRGPAATAEQRPPEGLTPVARRPVRLAADLPRQQGPDLGLAVTAVSA